MAITQAKLKITVRDMYPNSIEVTEGSTDNLHIVHKELNKNIPWKDVVPYYLALYALGNSSNETELNNSLESCDSNIIFNEFVKHFIDNTTNIKNAYFKVLEISSFFVPLLFENQKI
jgi:hypothetical protein